MILIDIACLIMSGKTLLSFLYRWERYVTYCSELRLQNLEFTPGVFGTISHGAGHT